MLGGEAHAHGPPRAVRALASSPRPLAASFTGRGAELRAHWQDSSEVGELGLAARALDASVRQLVLRMGSP
eukprot:13926524-Alexandrium_andersonii.AAC.1